MFNRPSSCPLHWWCHPAISSSDALFSFCPQSFPALVTLPMSQLFASGDQNTEVSASTWVLSMSIQGLFLLRLTSLIFLSRDSKESSLALRVEGINSLVLCLLYGPALTSMRAWYTQEISRHPSLPTLDKAWAPEALLSGTAFLLLRSLTSLFSFWISCPHYHTAFGPAGPAQS